MEDRTLIPLVKLNDSFSSYQDFRSAVERYEKVNRVQFYNSDAKRLHRAPPTTYAIVKNYPALEYCSVKLSCVYGGKAVLRRRSCVEKKLKKSRGSFRQGCKAEIFASLNDAKDKLIVSRLNENHNHELPTAEVIKQLSSLRKSSERSRRTKRHTSQKQFNERLLKSEGVAIQNIVKSNSLSRSKNFEKISKILNQKYVCRVDLQSDEDDKIYGFFFQDEYMKKSFQLFPEFLTIDGTYKLQNIDATIYIFSTENSLGSSNVVGVAVVTVPDKTSVHWMLDRFKERNPETEKVGVILTDRQTNESEISHHFPTSEILICTFHAFHTVKREICECHLIKSESVQCFEFFKKLIDAQNDEEYKLILEDMEDSVPYPFTKYYYDEWHRTRNLWAKNFSKSRTFIRNKLSDPHSHFRSKITSRKTFISFIETLFQLLYRRRTELKKKIAKTLMKVYSGGDEIGAGQMYDKCLTAHAFEKIERSLHLAAEEAGGSAAGHFRTQDGDTVYQTADCSFVVSEFSCMCDFFTVLKLPCEHILAYRKLHGMDLFAEYLFSKRWSRQHLRQLLASDVPAAADAEEKTSDEKFGEVEPVCWELAALCSRVSTGEFHGRLALLKRLKDSWEKKERVVLRTELETSYESDIMDVEDEESTFLEFDEDEDGEK